MKFLECVDITKFSAFQFVLAIVGVIALCILISFALYIVLIAFDNDLRDWRNEK